MTRRLVLLALAPVLLLGFTSCGSDDSSDSLSADDYKAEANQVCKDGQKRLEGIGADVSADSSEDEVADALSKLADEVQSEIDDIRDLQGPDAIESDVHDVLDDADQAIDDLRAKIEDDPIAAADMPAFDDINQRLVDLGLDTCGAE